MRFCCKLYSFCAFYGIFDTCCYLLERPLIPAFSACMDSQAEGCYTVAVQTQKLSFFVENEVFKLHSYYHVWVKKHVRHLVYFTIVGLDFPHSLFICRDRGIQISLSVPRKKSVMVKNHSSSKKWWNFPH